MNNSSKCSNCNGPRAVGGPAVFYNKSYLLQDFSVSHISILLNLPLVSEGF